MMIVLYVILGIYLLLIGSFIIGFRRWKEFKSKKTVDNVGFSIIIPFRNEVENLPRLLESLTQLNYPKEQFECLFVDDASSDSSIQIIKNHLENSSLSYRILINQRRSKSPKKDAILTAIQQAQFDWILTTDADCIVLPTWLHTFAEFSQQQPTRMIVGPVNYKSVNYSLLEHFQILDFLSLQGSTLGGFGVEKPFLCNGANLAYKKDTFLKLNGFEGNDDIASGDDIFLFEKFLISHPKEVLFLKSTLAMVTTFPLNSWKAVIQQRIRWAAKSSSYTLGFAKFVGLMVFLANLGFIIALGRVFWQPFYFVDFILFGVLKTLTDYRLIADTSRFYRGKNKKVRDFEFGTLFYPFFTVFIAIKSLISGYRWKGRSFKK